jgi:SAM-dependent methyltransferase
MDLTERVSSAASRRHPWETARVRFFLRQLRRKGVPSAGARVLDVGSGDGWFAHQLAEAADVDVTCWDTGYGEHPHPELPRLRCTAEAPGGTFELVMAMDVTEHVEDDAGFVRMLAEHLTPGGHLLMSVPAWPALFSDHDRFLKHVRRYRPGEARGLLEAAGLRVLRSGGLFHSVLPLRAAQAAREQVLPGRGAHAGEWRGGPVLTRIVQGVFDLEARGSELLARAGLEVPGLSWWALCRKP